MLDGHVSFTIEFKQIIYIGRVATQRWDITLATNTWIIDQIEFKGRNKRSTTICSCFQKGGVIPCSSVCTYKSIFFSQIQIQMQITSIFAQIQKHCPLFAPSPVKKWGVIGKLHGSPSRFNVSQTNNGNWPMFWSFFCPPRSIPIHPVKTEILARELPKVH